LSRELKSLQEELAAGRRERAAAPAPSAALSAAPSESATAAAAGQPETALEAAEEQELRGQFRNLVKEITDYVDDMDKNIAAHPAMSVITALLVGILIGRLLARR
jgi:ElaB/YqjD/DUF883 family membrane-anchored ribosome-binding protein